MKREYPDSAMVGVGAVIVQDARVLLVKRGQAPLKDCWSIPGGVLELGETMREAAVREAREETGLVVDTGELLGVFDRVIRDEAGRVQYHYVLVNFLCRVTSGELKAAGDAAEARWFAREELAGLKLAEDALEVIARAFDRQR